MNEYNGESTVTLAGTTYTLRLTTNRMALLERLLECRGGLLARLLDAGPDTIRAVLQVCLTVPERKGVAPLVKRVVTLDDVGDMLDDSGGCLLHSSPISIAYHELLIVSGLADRAKCELFGLVPVKGPKPEAVPVPVRVEEPEAVVPGI